MEEGNTCYVAIYHVSKAFDAVWIDGLFRHVFDMGISGKTWLHLYRSYVNFSCCAKVQGHFSDCYPLRGGIHQGGYMSLLKYTIFINSLPVQLKESGYCCKIYQMPSILVGYADDLAAGCINERKLNNVMKIVYQHGCTWRYEFNAKKSVVLVNGKNTSEQRSNKQARVFHLGAAKVEERQRYDHVSIGAAISEDDVSGIKERLSKACKTLNAVTGLIIRKNGLTISTCNVIFSLLVITTALFGSEIWILSDKSISLLETFQFYACKKIQHFYSMVLNSCCMYALGWMRLERFIQVKKLLLIRSM